jgi:hypothetical protein
MIIRIDPTVPRAGVPPPLPLPPYFTKDLSELISVDGKPFLKDDSPDRSDPKAGDIGLLWILLWAPRRTDHNYEFSFAGRADLDGRKTLMVDITYSTRWYSVGPVDVLTVGNLNRVPSVAWQGDSFSVLVQQTGRIWIDPDTYDVLQLETRTKPFEFERPGGRGKLKFEFNMTARFRSMTFENPQQTLMVPESIETVQTVRYAASTGSHDPSSAISNDSLRTSRSSQIAGFSFFGSVYPALFDMQEPNISNKSHAVFVT